MIAVCSDGVAYDKLKLSFLKRHRKKGDAERFLIENSARGAEGDFLNGDWKQKDFKRLNRMEQNNSSNF
ncbi:MAG: hypothetical protein VB078_04465 [Clostridiaceae bacterium]|nr:hypothetical protein [Clostridiaceae bacterium]